MTVQPVSAVNNFDGLLTGRVWRDVRKFVETFSEIQSCENISFPI